MTDSLKTGRAGAPVGTAGAVLVLLHGYGANGDDLLSLAPVLAPDLPGWAFLAPDAPDPCPGAPGGRQWAPIPWLDGSDAVAAAVAFHRSAGLLAGLIDTAQTEFGLGPGRVFLFGFSQGAMLALHVAPRLAAPLGGVVAASGRLLEPGRLAAATVARPPVLLLHGDCDEVVPPAALPEAEAALAAAGFDVRTHISRGTGHGIAPDGLGAALAFLRKTAGPAAVT
jgi:phospholipase/carboxylesterase